MSSPSVRGTEPLPRLPLPGATPREVRAALRPEFREQFDQDYRAALEQAARTLELADVLDTVEHWRTRAWVTRDPAEHRRVVRRAAELLTGQALRRASRWPSPRPGCSGALYTVVTDEHARPQVDALPAAALAAYAEACVLSQPVTILCRGSSPLLRGVAARCCRPKR